MREREGGVELRVRLTPRASRNGVAGLYGDRLKIQITAVPAGGAANKALERFVAKAAGVPPTSVRVVTGAKDRSKTVLIQTDQVAAVVSRVCERLRPADEGEGDD